MMEARATAKYVRVSARKTNQVLALVRGQDVESAIQVLTFTPRHVARTVLKTLKSAVANAVAQESRLNPDDLFVKECIIGPAPIMKRFLPRAQGRATPILKRSCHFTIVVGAKEGALDRFEAHAAPVKSKTAEAAEAQPAPAAKTAPPAGAPRKPVPKSAAKPKPGKAKAAKASDRAKGKKKGKSTRASKRGS
jgi:large subunit ribosomal protein L22